MGYVAIVVVISHTASWQLFPSVRHSVALESCIVTNVDFCRIFYSLLSAQLFVANADYAVGPPSRASTRGNFHGSTERNVQADQNQNKRSAKNSPNESPSTYKQAANDGNASSKNRGAGSQPVQTSKTNTQADNIGLNSAAKRATSAAAAGGNLLTSVRVLTGDILCQTVDAVVSPSNSHLKPQRGLFAAIAHAAGPEFARDCQAVIRQGGPLPINRVVHTTAGNLKDRIKYVLHVVGPRADEHTDDNKLFGITVECFHNCLLYANSVIRIESLSFPAIGAGNFFWLHVLILQVFSQTKAY
jgi:O-acetyl-ADP-ribose deacetylase (regulator of RNase III)